MTDDASGAAFPRGPAKSSQSLGTTHYDYTLAEGGLTKREYFAGLIMASQSNAGGLWLDTEHTPEMARRSVIAADALLKALSPDGGADK